MWGQITGTVVALLGIAASANLLLGARTRRVSTIRQEVDLMNALPPSPVKNALHRRIQHDLWRHVRIADNTRMWRQLRAMQSLAWIAMASWIGGGVAMVVAGFTKNDGFAVATAAAGVIGLTALLAALLMLKVLKPKIDAVIEAGPPVNELAPEE